MNVDNLEKRHCYFCERTPHSRNSWSSRSTLSFITVTNNPDKKHRKYVSWKNKDAYKVRNPFSLEFYLSYISFLKGTKALAPQIRVEHSKSDMLDLNEDFQIQLNDIMMRKDK